jgi:hypothetical protein
VGKAGETGNPSQPKKLDIGVVAALGVAVGGITAALGALLQAFFGLGLFMPIGLLGALLLISGPSMLIAGLKLRQRNIGPLLDASGWGRQRQREAERALWGLADSRGRAAQRRRGRPPATRTKRSSARGGCGCCWWWR